MTNEKLENLLKLLIEDSKETPGAKMPAKEESRIELVRKLMTARRPEPVGKDLKEAQDAWLKEVRAKKGDVKFSSLPCCDVNPNIILWKGDITTLKADAVVNSANPSLEGCYDVKCNCLDRQVHLASGMQLRNECAKTVKENGKCGTGFAMISHSFNLPSKYIIHTVGPKISGRPTKDDRKMLISCYFNCMELCVLNELKSIAFPCISAGGNGYPQDEAAQVAVRTITDYLSKNDGIAVIFVTFTQKDYDIYRQLLYIPESSIAESSGEAEEDDGKEYDTKK